jgi:hypothetical protein
MVWVGFEIAMKIDLKVIRKLRTLTELLFHTGSVNVLEAAKQLFTLSKVTSL